MAVQETSLAKIAIGLIPLIPSYPIRVSSFLIKTYESSVNTHILTKEVFEETERVSLTCSLNYFGTQQVQLYYWRVTISRNPTPASVNVGTHYVNAGTHYLYLIKLTFHYP